jgi:hypothetical protein
MIAGRIWPPLFELEIGSMMQRLTQLQQGDPVAEAPVIASKTANNTQFADKEQVCADNAESARSSGTSASATGSSSAAARSR